MDDNERRFQEETQLIKLENEELRKIMQNAAVKCKAVMNVL